MKIFIFDLDFTLWNAGDTFCSNTVQPYTWKDNLLFDATGKWIRLYPDTTDVLKAVRNSGCPIVAASRTFTPDNAQKLLELLNIDHFFDHKEIYPGTKVAHMTSIKNAFNADFNDLLFFDDEERNVNETRELGVNSFLVKDGISLPEVKKFL